MTTQGARADGRDGTCLLVFGVSGVGKTSACQRFVTRHPEFLYYRASALLSEALAATPEMLRTGSARQIEANQGLLGRQLGACRAAHRTRPVLVDVHGVIDNDRELVRVPVETVASLEPAGMVLLEASPSVVVERRRGDPRPRPVRTPEEIAAELAAERAAVLHYASTLELPLEIVQATEEFELDPVVQALITRVEVRGA